MQVIGDWEIARETFTFMAPSHHHRHRALASYLQLYHTEIIIAISGNCRFWDRVKVKPFMAIWAAHSGPPPTSSPQYGSIPLTHFLFLALAVSFWSQLPIWRIQHYLIYPSCKMLRSPVGFWVPQNQTNQFLIPAQTQKWRKHLPDKISKLLFQVWKNHP